MSMPRVSILLPVRNEALHLPSALRSLQSQTLRDWELVAVDDGSTDSTPEILQDFANTDPRFRVIKQPADGLVSALNLGLDTCRAEYVARMDGDDICHPQRLNKQLERLRNEPSLTLVATCVRHFPRSKIQGGMLAYETWQNGILNHREICSNLFVETPFTHPSVMFRRTDILDAGGYRRMPWAEDYDLWLRLAERGARFGKLPETLLFWRDRPQRLTRTADNCTLGAFRSCKTHFLRRSFLKNSVSVTLWGTGPEGKAWRKCLLKVGVMVDRWIDVDPRKIGQTIHNATVCGPEALRNQPRPTLITVGTKGARKQIRQWSKQAGLKEGTDFICVT